MRIIPILLALGLVAGGAVAPAASAVPDDGSITLAASPAFSGALQPNQPLLISGTITNGSDETQTAGVVSVSVGGASLATRRALSGWLNSADSRDALLDGVIATFLVGELVPGQMRSFNVTIPASAIPFSPNKPGVYPLSVSLDAQEVQLDFARSTVVWASDASQQSLDLSVIAPLVPSATSSGILSADELDVLTAPGGALDTQLSLAHTHSLALGVDPRILASIRLLGTNAPVSASNWLGRLESSPADRFLLAYADANLALENAAGAKAPLAPTSFPIDSTHFPDEPEATPVPSTPPATAEDLSLPSPESLVALSGALPGIIWPSESGVSVEDLDFFAEGGYSRTLTASTSITHLFESSPNMVVGEHQLTVYDATVSSLLREAALAQSLAEWSQAMSALTGALSITATEHPGATVVAALGRDGSASGVSLDKTLTSLATQPWITPLSLPAALAVPSLPASLTASSHEDERASVVKELLASEKATARFATVVDEPSLVTGPQRLDLLALLSTAWEQQPFGWQRATEAFLATNSELRSSVHLPESSTVTLLQEKSNLPIAVRNELAFPVTVYVSVQPERAVLHVLDGHVELKIEANSQAKVLIPVQSIANGEVRTRVTLSSAANEPISTPIFLVLNVQAGWETAATVVLAVIIVVMFVAGIWRTVLRRRKALADRAQDLEHAG